MAVHAELQNVLVGDLVADKKDIIQTDATTLVRDAIDAMHKHDIRCLPVFDREAAQYIGILDLMDVLIPLAFTDYFENQSVKEAQFAAYKSLKLTAADVLGLTDESKKMWTYEPSSRLVDVLRPLSLGVHRVLVSQVDDATRRHTYRILSQTDAARWLLAHKDKLASTLGRKLKDLPIRSRVESITEKDSALEGFRKMVQNSLTGIAIVDSKTGALLGTLSKSDIRGLTSSKLHHVTKPVFQYLSAMELTREPISCTPEDTILSALEKAVRNKIHRIWIVDAANRPAGVVTYSDILALFSA